MSTNSTPARQSRQHSVYRAVLSLAVAALIAASIPFAAIYVSTIHRPPSLSALAPASGSRGTLRLLTTASGSQIAVPATGNSVTPAARVRTRSSGAATQSD